MKQTRYRPQKKLKDPFTKLSISIPTNTYNAILNLAIANNIPIVNIVNRILFAHFKGDEWDLYGLPDTVSVENETDDETLLKFILSVKVGVDLDIVVCLQDMIGIPDTRRILHAVRRNVDKGLIHLTSTHNVQRLIVPPHIREHLKGKKMFKKFMDESMRTKRPISNKHDAEIGNIKIK